LDDRTFKWTRIPGIPFKGVSPLVEPANYNIPEWVVINGFVREERFVSVSAFDTLLIESLILFAVSVIKAT